MSFKPSSLAILPCQGGCTAEEGRRIPSRWPISCSFRALGHTLQNDGSVRACWLNTKSQMWRSFFANSVSAAARGLPLNSKLKLLDSATAGILRARYARWPPQMQLAREINSVQRRMIASIMRTQRKPSDIAQTFSTRRFKEAALVMNNRGHWSRQWCQAALNFDDHILRNHIGSPWTHPLRTFRDSQWLQSQRLIQQASSVLSGATGTRVARGHVFQRWENGTRFARDALDRKVHIR